MPTRTCRRCAVEFHTESPYRKVCDACLAPRTCVVCGTVFEVVVTRNLNARCCSHPCAMRSAARDKANAVKDDDPVRLPLVPLPRTRAECPAVRPCPYQECRYHLPTSCALDMADEGPRPLHKIAAMMGLPSERVRQIEVKALRRLVAIHGPIVLKEILSRADATGYDLPPDPGA